MTESTATTTSDPIDATAMSAWRRYLRSHSCVTRQLDAQLQAAHGLTISDYDVLVHLRDAPEQHLRMSELAERVLLTRSGITRLIDGLERDGYVRRQSCPSDARVSHAVITDEGLERLAEARQTHLRGIRDTFTGNFSDDELRLIDELFSRLTGCSDA